MDGGRQQLQRRRPEQSVLHRAVREGWPLVLAAAEAQGGFPKRVHEEVRRYLACGDVRRGFTLVKCTDCAASALIAFSCKSRGWCPSCAARRAHEASLHLLEVLPQIPYRQWTLSLPFALRFTVVKEPKLLRVLERCVTRSIFRWLRARAKQLGHGGRLLCGSVCFVQLFSSSLTLQPHFHLLVPQGIFDGATFIELPPPSQEEVEGVLARMLAQARRTFESLEAAWPLDAFEALKRQSAQERLDLGVLPQRQGKALVAVGEGFSLHAGTKTHANDRHALARLCRYGARGPIAESRLTLREDGRYEYQTKKGVTLVLTAAQLTRRLISLIPPVRLHLVNFYGAFSSHSNARSTLLPKAAPLEQAKASGTTATSPKTKRPRIDWATLHARTWGVDVWLCTCGGKRKVMALVTSRRIAEEMLRNMGLLPPSSPRPVALAQAPPQLELLPHSN